MFPPQKKETRPSSSSNKATRNSIQKLEDVSERSYNRLDTSWTSQIRGRKSTKRLRLGRRNITIRLYTTVACIEHPHFILSLHSHLGSIALPTTRCVRYQVPGHSLYLGQHGASERFVGSSIRIVLAPVAPFVCPNNVLWGCFFDLPNQIPLSHAVSPLWSLFPDDNPRCSGAKILNKTVSANGTISCV